MNASPGMLMRLAHSDQMMADPDHDIRGHKVLDRDGTEIGKVDDLLIDQEHHQVRLLQVAHGGLFGLGATNLFIPVEAVVRVDRGEVGVDLSRLQMAAAPGYDPEIVDRDEQMSALYGYYGYTPYWVPGHLPPPSRFFR
jgi:sporulation protein YlmC with PRC-barrel domain